MPPENSYRNNQQLPLESEDNRRTHCGNDGDNIYSMFAIERRNDGVLTTTLTFNDKTCIFQVDTGAAVSIISEKIMESLWKTSLDYHRPRLVHSSVKLKTVR